MPDLQAQWERHDDYVDLPIQGYVIWWRDEGAIKSSSSMPRGEAEAVVRHLNQAYYPVTFWQAPCYDWSRLIVTAGV